MSWWAIYWSAAGPGLGLLDRPWQNLLFFHLFCFSFLLSNFTHFAFNDTDFAPMYYGIHTHTFKYSTNECFIAT